MDNSKSKGNFVGINSDIFARFLSLAGAVIVINANLFFYLT